MDSEGVGWECCASRKRLVGTPRVGLEPRRRSNWLGGGARKDRAAGAAQDGSLAPDTASGRGDGEAGCARVPIVGHLWPRPPPLRFDIPGSAASLAAHSPQPAGGESPQAKQMLLSIALIHLQRGGIIARVATDAGRFCPSLAPLRLAPATSIRAFSNAACFCGGERGNRPAHHTHQRGRTPGASVRQQEGSVSLSHPAQAHEAVRRTQDERGARGTGSDPLPPRRIHNPVKQKSSNLVPFVWDAWGRGEGHPRPQLKPYGAIPLRTPRSG